MNITPARGYILVEPIEAEETSAGGVILPDRVKDMPQKGKVLAVGEALTPWPYPIYGTEEGIESAKRRASQYFPPVEVGDTVIFKRFVDNRIKEEGKELLLVKFEDILGVYEE